MWPARRCPYLRLHGIPDSATMTGNWVATTLLLLAQQYEGRKTVRGQISEVGAQESSSAFIIKYLIVPQQSIQHRLAYLVDEETIPAYGRGDSRTSQFVTGPTNECGSAGRRAFHWSIHAQCKSSRLPPKQMDIQGAGLFCSYVG